MNYVFLDDQLVAQYGPLDKHIYHLNSYIYDSVRKDWFWVYDAPGKGAVYSRAPNDTVPNWAKALLLLIT